MKSILSFLCVLCASAVNLPAEWPSFRGPGASGIGDGLNAPLTWNAEKGTNVLWRTAIPGLGHSSPVVWGDRVFLTTAISSDPRSVFRPGLYGAGEPAEDVSPHTWKVYCLDRKTGRILWERTAREGQPRIKRHPKNTQASATPAADGRHVAAFFGSEGLYVYDFNGKLLWQQDLGVIDAGAFDVPEFQWGTASSPIIYKDLVIVQCDSHKNSFMAAYDADSGKRVWHTPREALPSWSTPTVYEGKTRAELIANGTEHIRGYDPLTGKELWKLHGTSMISVPTPFVARDTIFVASGYRRYMQPIYAIRPGAAGDISLKEGSASNQHIAWSTRSGAPYLPTPLVYGDYLYTCAIQGVLACYRADTGERLYERRIGDKGGAYSASPVAADGRLYLTSEDGEIFVVKAGPAYEVLAVNPMGEVCMATPAIARNMLLIRTQHQLIAVGKP